jgi:hypothetical protein
MKDVFDVTRNAIGEAGRNNDNILSGLDRDVDNSFNNSN